MEYIEDRGVKTISEIRSRLGARFRKLGRSQDMIGWRRFMEGMISKEMVVL